MVGYNKAVGIGILTSGILGAFVGYYFLYRKRRSDSLFAQSQRMHNKLKTKEIGIGGAVDDDVDGNASKRRMFMSHAEIKQLFFAQEVHLGEQEFARGNFAGGSKHFALAVTVYEDPDRFLQILQQVLPAHIFIMILQEVQVIQREIDNGRKLEREHFNISSN